MSYDDTMRTVRRIGAKKGCTLVTYTSGNNSWIIVSDIPECLQKGHSYCSAVLNRNKITNSCTSLNNRHVFWQAFEQGLYYSGGMTSIS